MSSTAIEREPLGGSTLARKYFLDIDTSATSTPSWIGVFGVGNFQAALDTTMQDDSDYDSDGERSSTATARAWSIRLTVNRKTQVATPTAYDPGQEALRLAADQLGPDNTVHIRWYEMTPDGPRVEAYEGYAAVSWSPNGGAMDALDTVAVVLTGQGKRIPITHPDAA